ncbi:MAG TPA: TadE/TadG family type IV pilus assembly protein [Allosphingosinicella sp.]
MRRLFARMRRDRRGVSAVEFALIAPVFIFMIVAVAQFGALFYAHSALRNAVSEGARYATIYPRPSATEIIARVNANRATGNNGTYSTPTVVFAQDTATGYWRATVSMTYTTNVNFLLFTWPNVTLSYSRRAYVQAPPA